MDVVRLLPDNVANQIAAGEVIQRPASCLKELVENALDAGATRVQVIVRDAGRTLLQVIDNGCGMSDTDARMAFERHATSKIKQASDLFSLHTMGFRGEALPSICAVAQVQLQTRTKDAELGTLLEIHGSQVMRQEPVQCPVGTNIRVSNLFFNVPARRKFLKSDQTELRNLLQAFYRIVLVYPQVQFTFVSQDEILLDLPAATEKQRIEALFGKTQRHQYTQALVDIQAKTELITIHGFVGKTEEASRSPQQYFFVNGRYMRHPYFHKAVMSAYEGLLPQGLSPSYFIYFDISPEAIDVNIHPTKTEIKFADEQLIYPIILAAVRESLGKFNVTAPLDFDVSGKVEIPLSGQHTDYNPFAEHRRASVPSQWQSLYAGSRVQPTLDLAVEDKPLQDKESEQALSDVMIRSVLNTDGWQEQLVQVSGRFIALPVADGVLLIHQHRAHICVLHQQIMSRLEQHNGERQSLLFPDIWDVNPEDMSLVEEVLPELSALGFDLERMAKYSFSLSAVPAILPAGQAIASLQQIVGRLREQQRSARQQFKEQIASSLAQSAAIPSGKQLQTKEMEDIVRHLFALPAYRYTADGKVVMLFISGNRLNSLF